jgi:hypothetical protein
LASTTLQDKARARDSLEHFKKMLKTNVKARNKDTFKSGNMVAFGYIAKNEEVVYDKSPLIFSLRQSNGYVLGLNFHWVPKPARKVLMDYIFKLNKNNIARGLPLNINYKILVPIISRLKLRAVIRLYIKARISKKAMIIPHEYFMKAIYLPAENFSNGHSAEQLYKRAVNKSKLKKKH